MTTSLRQWVIVAVPSPTNTFYPGTPYFEVWSDRFLDELGLDDNSYALESALNQHYRNPPEYASSPGGPPWFYYVVRRDEVADFKRGVLIPADRYGYPQ